MQTQSSWSSAAARCWDVWCGLCSSELSDYFWSILVLWWSNYFTFWGWGTLSSVRCMFSSGGYETSTLELAEGALGGGFFCLCWDESKQFWCFTKPNFSTHGGTGFPKALDQTSLPSKYYVIKIMLLPNEITVGLFFFFNMDFSGCCVYAKRYLIQAIFLISSH